MNGSIWMSPKKPGILFVLFLLLLGAAVVLFLIAADKYYTYVSASVESAAAVPVIGKQEAERLTSSAEQEKLNTDIKFRNFFLTFSGAKKVELQADFNGWGKVPLELHPYSKGYFEVSVALPAGEYKYVFVVDGKDVLDPNNLDRTEQDGRKVCIKTVK